MIDEGAVIVPALMRQRRTGLQQLESFLVFKNNSAAARLIVLLFLWLSAGAISTTSLVHAMRIVVQRVHSASVTTVQGTTEDVVSRIGPGILALVGLHEHDSEQDLQECCKKLLACKLWENESGGLWRHSVKQKGYDVLLVSQFTLYGTLSKKNQPDYKRAMKNAPAQALYGQFVNMVRQAYEPDRVQDGVFGAMMNVTLVNDGPVTLMIESEPQPPTTSLAAEKTESA